jgi:hypothetical protein
MGATKHPLKNRHSTMTNKPLAYSVVTSHNSNLTKTLKLENGKILSTNPALYRGFSEHRTTTLAEFPSVIKNLNKNQCLATGWMDSKTSKVEVLTRSEFEARKLSYPVHEDDSGIYGTRSKLSMIQKGSSLIMLDYDPDPQNPNKIDNPEDFLYLLNKALPEANLSNVSYVRDYSTSTALYDKKSGQVIREPEGFHIYMQINAGENLEAFAKHLELGCWRANLGYIKIGSSANRLTRTILDLAVFTPERLIYAAGADIAETETFYQNLPMAEYVEKDIKEINTKTFKKLTPKQSAELLSLQTQLKESDSVMERVQAKKQQLETRLVSKNHFTKHPLTEQEAQRTVSAMSRYILHPEHIIYFEDGREITVAELLQRSSEFDGVGVLDPFRPDKGFSRAKFYANLTEQAPVINSFVEGGRTFNLNDTYNEFIRVRTVEHSDIELLTLDPVILNERYFPEITLKKGITLLKGEKGTGKTTAIARKIKACEGRVLAISHRISLVSTLCKDFNLTSYNTFNNDKAHLIRPEPRLGVCYNSLHRVSGLVYDFVVIDEFVQLIRTIKSGIVKHKFLCLKVLRHLLQTAKYVILMDADMSKDIIVFLAEGEFSLFPEKPNFHVIVNKYLPAKGKKLNIYRDAVDINKPDRLSFVLDFREAIKDSGVFYASNSRNNILFMAAQAVEVLGGDPELSEEHFITDFGDKRVITITAHNSQTKDVQYFIKNINSELRETDIFMSSPSLGTGVSIDSVDGKPKLQKVFAYFTKRAENLPSDCLQHLARVRDCTDLNLVITHYNTHLELDPIKIVQTEVLGNKGILDKHLTSLAVFNWETGAITFNDQGWTTYYGELTARENLEKNSFYPNFIQQIAVEGFELEDASSAPTQLCQELKVYEQNLKKTLKQVERETLINTPLITDKEFEELKSKLTLTADEQRQYFKKAQADLFGFPQETDELNDLITLSSAKLKGRATSLIIGANADDLALLDVISRLDKKRHAFYLRALFDRRELLLGLLEHLHITVDDLGLSFDETPLTDYELYLTYEYLYSQADKIKIIFGSEIKEVANERDYKKEISKSLKWLGLTWETGSRIFSQVNGVRKRLASISLSSFEIMVSDIKRAQKNSKSRIFTPLVRIPDNLRSYVFSLVNGGTYSEYNSFFEALEPSYRQRVDAALLRIYEGIYRAAA